MRHLSFRLLHILLALVVLTSQSFAAVTLPHCHSDDAAGQMAKHQAMSHQMEHEKAGPSGKPGCCDHANCEQGHCNTINTTALMSDNNIGLSSALLPAVLKHGYHIALVSTESRSLFRPPISR